MSKAYEQGVNGFKRGMTLDQNPYKYGAQLLAVSWANGWTEAADLADRHV
jgi:ribosome modulation factor